jgi:hypothetical protein
MRTEKEEKFMTVTPQTNLNSVHQAQEVQQLPPRPEPQSSSKQQPDTVELSQTATDKMKGGG